MRPLAEETAIVYESPLSVSPDGRPDRSACL